MDLKMIDYAIALTFPSEVSKGLNGLREKYKEYVGYTIEPHLTLAYPFVPTVDISIIKEKLEAVARKTKTFTLVLNGIEYFEEGNNVAYAAVENKQPVIGLHIDVMSSLEGFITEENTDGMYDFERFIPHVTIGAQIPDEVFPTVKKLFLDYELHYEVTISSFTLFSSGEDAIWKPERVFEFSEN